MHWQHLPVSSPEWTPVNLSPGMNIFLYALSVVPEMSKKTKFFSARFSFCKQTENSSNKSPSCFFLKPSVLHPV